MKRPLCAVCGGELTYRPGIDEVAYPGCDWYCEVCADLSIHDAMHVYIKDIEPYQRYVDSVRKQVTEELV